MEVTATYYTEYTDHMWRFYVRHRDGNIADMDYASRANWTACHNVWLTIRPEWRDVLNLYYQQDPHGISWKVNAYCAKHHDISPADVWKIVNAARNMAAQERGLVGEFTARKGNAIAIAPGEKPAARKPTHYRNEE